MRFTEFLNESVTLDEIISRVKTSDFEDFIFSMPIEKEEFLEQLYYLNDKIVTPDSLRKALVKGKFFESDGDIDLVIEYLLGEGEDGDFADEIGINWAVDPKSFDEIKDDHMIDDLRFFKLKKKLGHIEEYDAKEMFTLTDVGPQQEYGYGRPQEEIFIINFPNGDRYLVKGDSSVTHIKYWAYIRNAD